MLLSIIMFTGATFLLVMTLRATVDFSPSVIMSRVVGQQIRGGEIYLQAELILDGKSHEYVYIKQSTLPDFKTTGETLLLERREAILGGGSVVYVPHKPSRWQFSGKSRGVCTALLLMSVSALLFYMTRRKMQENQRNMAINGPRFDVEI